MQICVWDYSRQEQQAFSENHPSEGHFNELHPRHKCHETAQNSSYLNLNLIRVKVSEVKRSFSKK